MAVSNYNLEQLQQLALDRVESNSLMFTLPKVTAVINESIQVINLISGFLQSTIAVPGNSVQNQLVYQTPVGILFPLRVQFNGTQLNPTPLWQLASDYYTWATDNTNKRGSVSRWAPIGINNFVIHPADSIGGGTIFVTGVIEPTPLVNPDDSMPLEDEFVSLIMTYCAHRLVFIEGGQPFAQAAPNYQEFLSVMKSKKMFAELRFPRFFVMSGAPTLEAKSNR